MLVEAAVDGSAIGAHVDVEFFEFGGYGFNGCSELDDGFAGVAGAGVQARQGHHGAGPSDTDARTDYGSPDFDQGGEGVWFKLATVRSCVISGLGGAFYHDAEGLLQCKKGGIFSLSSGAPGGGIGVGRDRPGSG